MPDSEDRPEPRLDVVPPGPASRGLAERLRRVESRNVTRLDPEPPIFWRRARGCHVVDADDNRYVDLGAAFGVAVLGHSHPRVVEAVRAQAGELVHGMGDVQPPEVKVRLLERLSELAPWPEARATLGVSGAEAVEIALKTAALFTGRPGVLAFTGAYHGLTYGALSVTDGARFRAPFRAQLNPHVVRAPFPHPFRPPQALAGVPPEELPAAALARTAELLDGDSGRRVGAVIVEPIQGRGGDVVPPPGFLSGLAELCRERGLLLIADEVYTGFGRAGCRFAGVGDGALPDLLCVGKACSGGLPLSACLGRAEVMEAWPPSRGEAMHTSTFMGHPLACAAALATLDVLEERELAARAAREGARWMAALREVAASRRGVGEVRGRGLLVGIDLVVGPGSRRPDPGRARRVVREALRRGWILLPSGPEGNVLSLSPPLDVEREVLDDAVAMLDAVLRETATG